MSNFVNKVFKKNKSLKVYFLSHDRKIYIFHLLPKNDTVKVQHNNVTERYMFDSSKVFITSSGFDKNKPTIYLVEGNAEAINPFTLKSSYPAELFEVAMSNNLVKDIVKASETKSMGLEDILTYVILGLLVFIFYFLFQINNTLKTNGNNNVDIKADEIVEVYHERF